MKESSLSCIECELNFQRVKNINAGFKLETKVFFVVFVSRENINFSVTSSWPDDPDDPAQFSAVRVDKAEHSFRAMSP